MADGAWRWIPPENLSCRDVLEFLSGVPDGSVDAVICDPPYAFPGGFMGLPWDRTPGSMQSGRESLFNSGRCLLRPRELIVQNGMDHNDFVVFVEPVLNILLI